MIAAPATLVAPMLALLALVLAGAAWAAISITIMARRDERGWRAQAREASTRAALAESALADIRHRRSAATAQGNRTRAEIQRKKQRAMTTELQHAIEAKRTPQPEFPFPVRQTGDAK